MGGMMGVTGTMGTMGAWILLWILLALAVGVTGGIVIARSLHTQGSTGSPEIPPAESPAVQEANGEIGREEYLQGKVELED